MRFAVNTVLISAAVLVLLAGCGGMNSTVFLHPEYDFQFVQRVAIVPFENQSKEQGAGARVTTIFFSELLSLQVFEVIEPGEVNRVLQANKVIRTAELSEEQIKNIGSELEVQAIILGSVSELATMRSSSSTVNTVTLDVRMVETETGVTVWSSTHTSGGKGFWASLFGGGDKSQSEVIRECVKEILETLVD